MNMHRRRFVTQAACIGAASTLHLPANAAEFTYKLGHNNATTHPEHLRLCWTRLKAIMAPGKLDALTKEIIALAVSATNGCVYCINSHTAAVQKLGLDNEGLAEVLAVVGLYNQMNKLADAYQIEPDILPEAR